MTPLRLVGEWRDYRRGLPHSNPQLATAQERATVADFDALFQRYLAHAALLPLVSMEDAFIAMLVSQQVELRELRARVDALTAHV